jgi:hypothetical protein
MRGHGTPGSQRRHHLIHIFPMRDGPAFDAGTNFDCRIFWVHLQNFTREELVARMFASFVSHLSLANRH